LEKILHILKHQIFWNIVEVLKHQHKKNRGSNCILFVKSLFDYLQYFLIEKNFIFEINPKQTCPHMDHIFCWFMFLSGLAGNEEVKIATLSAIASWAVKSTNIIQESLVSFFASGLKEKGFSA
jgi:hypothetical protein